MEHKRIISLLLAILMLFGMPFTVSASPDTTPSTNGQNTNSNYKDSWSTSVQPQLFAPMDLRAGSTMAIPQFIMAASASSEETKADVCPASNAIDGSTSTIWHTEWSSGSAQPPHYLKIDLGRAFTVTGLTYLPRQDGNLNGTVTGYKVTYSLDDSDYTEAASGTWENDINEKTASWTGVSAQYIKLETPDNLYMSCAEMNILTSDEIYQPLWSAWPQAEQCLTGIEIGSKPEQYPQDAVNTFQEAIDAAKLAIANPEVNNQEAIQAATAALQTAQQTFLNSVNKYTKANLEALVAEATSLNDETAAGSEDGQVPQDEKDTFARAITTAKSVAEGDSATEMAIHQAYLDLRTTYETFQAHIATKLISLAGTWQLKLGAYKAGDAEKTLGDTLQLPGTLEENKKGSPNSSVDTGKLNRTYLYTGAAVYQKPVYIHESWQGKTVTLLMERTKVTRVWVNGVEQTACNANDTIGTPQVYTLSNLNYGAENTLTIEVRNTGYVTGGGSHMLTEETVTDWNGILGRFELEAKDPVAVTNVRAYPDLANKTATVKVTVINPTGKAQAGSLTLSAASYNHDGAPHTPAVKTETFSLAAVETEKVIEIAYPMGEDVKLWSEFDPALYHLTVALTAGDNAGKKTVSFGMREFKASGNKFTINGLTTFMRGEGNSAVFPLTGYAYMTKEEWLDFFGKAQAMGINFFRFHSWTPPEAAFEAADELGIYMQPEYYAFGGTPFYVDNLSDTGKVRQRQYVFDEVERILGHLANHPSFVMLAWGNELSTDSPAKRDAAAELLAHARAIDSTRLYGEGSNNNFWNPYFDNRNDYWTTCKTKYDGRTIKHTRISFSWNDDINGGAIESLQPNTTHTYNDALVGFENVPVMNHEAGQYQVLPWFDVEIPKYESGIFRARNLETYRNIMEQNGILNMNEKFSRASARLSAIGYKADIETALRSELAGYQLLSIQDFPGQGTAHCGILDNFMDDKPGGFTKAEYKSFNDSVVVLGLLPKLVYTNGETLSAAISVSNYSPTALNALVGSWTLKNGETILASGSLDAKDVPQGKLVQLGEFTAPLSAVTEAAKLTVEVDLAALDCHNAYDIWVYPASVSTNTGDVLVVDNWSAEARDKLAEGGKVLLLPKPNTDTLPGSLAVRWMTDYWSKMFHSDTYQEGRGEKGFTLGMYIEKNHPIFAHFPTEEYSDYQWFNLAKGSRALNLTKANKSITPIIWNIDHMQWGRKLGSLFEANVDGGKLMVCTFDLLGQKETYPEAKQLYSSVLQYMNSNQFAPETTLEDADIAALVADEDASGRSAYQPINGVDDNSGAPLYDKGHGSLGWNVEDGSLEDGTTAKALGGIKSDGSEWFMFSQVRFGAQGADKLIVTGANGNTHTADLEIHLDSVEGPLLTTAHFTGTGSWNVYKSQTFDIKRVTGKHDVYVRSLNGSLAFHSIQFAAAEGAYEAPYTSLQPEMAANANILREGTMEVKQNYLHSITGSASITFQNTDFGLNGSNTVTICGRTKANAADEGTNATNNGADVSGRIQYEDSHGNALYIPFTFKAEQGTSYQLSSETFWQQTFPAKGITGIQNVKLLFDEDTLFDLESVVFTEGAYPRKVIMAKDYSSFTGNGVGLESRDAVGGFDKGETLVYNAVQLSPNGAKALTFSGANGRSASEAENIVTLRFRYGDGAQEYKDIVLKRTGAWTAEGDREVSVTLDPEIFHGEKDITVELIAGGLAFVNFSFVEADQKTIESVSGLGSITVDSGTAASDLPLPKTVTVALYGGSYLDLPVTWSCENYQKDTSGTYEFVGTLIVPAGVVNYNGKTAALTVKLSENQPVSKDALNAAIEDAKKLTESDYAAESWKAFKDALESAETVSRDENATQEVVDAAVKELTDAKDALVAVKPQPADKTALNAAIDEAKNLTENDYTAESWKPFADALKAAEDVLSKADATQDEVNAAATALTAAQSSLKKNDQPQPTVDKTALRNRYNELVITPNVGYTPESWANFQNALTYANTVLGNEAATQADVNSALEALNNAANGLTQIAPPTPVIPVTPSEPASNPFNPNAGSSVSKFPFVDIPSDSWYYSSVKAAWENGLIDGVTVNEFKPNATLTVAQTIKLAAALHQLDRTGEVSLKNGGANWYDSYVSYAVTNGIIEKDYANYSKAQMNAPVTRGEFVHIFHGAEEAYKTINTVADNAIPDVKATDKFAPEIYEFYRAGILTGSDAKGTFHSASTIKRSEAAAILLRMFEASTRKSIILN